LTLDVCGLGNFRNNVVFAKVKHDHQVSTLKNVAEIVEESFLDQDIISPDQRGFKPHITIMKLSSVKGSKKKGTVIN
jgi:2'-5' RNA ligase